jgi:hypothetical protein
LERSIAGRSGKNAYLGFGHARRDGWVYKN